MKKFVREIVFAPRTFAICYLPFLAVNMVQVINPMLFTRVFLAFFAVWGGIIAVKSFFTGKKIWLEKCFPALFAFLAVCLLTELINFRYGGVRKLGELCFLGICIAILFTQHRSGVTDYVRTVKWVSAILGGVISVMMLVSLWMFVNMYSVEVVTRSGITITIGFYQNRLYGVFSSPNVGGMFALILLWCGLAALYLRRDNKKAYPVWVLVSVIEVLLAAGYIGVALSRGTYLMGAAMIVAIFVLRPATAFEAKKSLWMQYGIRVVSAGLALVLSVGLIMAANSVMVGLMARQFENKYGKPDTSTTEPSGTGNPSDSKEEDDAYDILQDALQGLGGRVENDLEHVDVTNKRMDIWKNHLELVSNPRNLFLGINNPVTYYEKNVENGVTFTNQQKIFIEWAAGNLHNGYLQILINCGIVAFLLMMGFLVLCAVKSFGFFFRSVAERKACSRERYTLFALCMPMVVCILVNNVVETNFVLMGANFFQAMFWFVAGACVLCVSKGQEEKQ